MLDLNKILIFITFLFAGESMVSASQLKHPHDLMSGISIDLDYAIEDSKSHILTFKLSNNTDRELQFYNDLLQRNSMTLVVSVDNKWSETLEESFFPDNPPPGIRVVKPNEVVVESLNLNTHFPSINHALKNNSLIVFWSINLKPINEEVSQRFGGWLEINKQGT